MKKIVVLSGAGVSAESGISTFRDSNGLWENYNVEDVASIDGWYRNPELMIKFYNDRRRELEHCQPNDAHKIIAELEQQYEVVVVTQNVDNLHERGGSTHVIHLHGELTKACSERGKRCVEDIGYRDIKYGEKAADGGILRPFIVWLLSRTLLRGRKNGNRPRDGDGRDKGDRLRQQRGRHARRQHFPRLRLYGRKCAQGRA